MKTTSKQDDAVAAAETGVSDPHTPPFHEQQEPPVFRILYSDWYTWVEYCYFNLSIVVLWSVIFLPYALPHADSDKFRYWMYWIFCFIPHAGLFLPLQVAICRLFSFQEVVKLLSLWRLHVIEQLLLLFILFASIPVGLNQHLFLVPQFDGFWIVVPISASVLMHLLSYFLIEGKRTLVLHFRTQGRSRQDNKPAKKLLTRSWIRQRIAIGLPQPQHVLQQMKASYGRIQVDTDEEEEEQPVSGKESATDPTLLLLRLYSKFPWLSMVFALFGIAEKVLISLIPLTVGWVVSAFAHVDETTPYWDMMGPGLLLVGNSLLIPVFSVVASHSAFRIGSSIEIYLKEALFQTVCGAHKEWNSNDVPTSPGDLTSLFSDDARNISYFMSECMQFDVTSGAIRYVASVVVLGTLDWRMAYFFALCVPAMVVVNLQAAQQSQESGNPRGGLFRRFQNLVGLQRTLNLYQTGEFAWSKTSALVSHDFDQLTQTSTRQASFVSTVAAATNIYVGLLTISLLFSAIRNVQNGMGSQVELTSIGLGIIVGLFSPVNQLSRAGQRWLEVIQSLQRMEFCIRNNKSNVGKPDIEQGGQGESQTSADFVLNKALTVEKVKFHYPGSSTLILKGVDAEFTVGKYYCIVGGSGAGKSTILNILTREIHETEGKVLVDGNELPIVSLYRDHIGIVLQDSAFFDGSVKDNILLGRPSASDEDVQLAIGRAQCADFVAALPNGVHTQLGEGVMLSGGQAQRISLARALVRHPKLLFLDEATSALDPLVEKDVIDTITNLARSEKMSVISITHRLDTTDPCDEIYVLKEGVVCERGSPEELNVPGTLFSSIRGSAKQTS